VWQQKTCFVAAAEEAAEEGWGGGGGNPRKLERIGEVVSLSATFN